MKIQGLYQFGVQQGSFSGAIKRRGHVISGLVRAPQGDLELLIGSADEHRLRFFLIPKTQKILGFDLYAYEDGYSGGWGPVCMWSCAYQSLRSVQEGACEKSVLSHLVAAPQYHWSGSAKVRTYTCTSEGTP